jgi:S1-C subfamily serine protease
MNLQRFRGKSKVLAGALIIFLGLAGWGVARASQKFFTPGIHISMKMADPAEGPSKTGFSSVVKTVLPDVVNISTSKVVKGSEHPGMPEGMDNMPPFFQQFFGSQNVNFWFQAAGAE